MNCNCNLGEVCNSIGGKLQAIDWTSPTGKNYRLYLDKQRFEQLFDGLKDIPQSELPKWGCRQKAFSHFMGD